MQARVPLDDYDEIDEDERREPSHIISGYSGTASSATTSLPTSTSSSVFPVRPSAQTVDVVPSSLSSAAITPIAPTTVHPLIQSSSLSSQSPVPSQMLFHVHPPQPATTTIHQFNTSTIALLTYRTTFGHNLLNLV